MTVRKYPQQTSVPEAEPPPPTRPTATRRNKAGSEVKIEFVIRWKPSCASWPSSPSCFSLPSSFGITPDQLVRLVQVLFK